GLFAGHAGHGMAGKIGLSFRAIPALKTSNTLGVGRTNPNVWQRLGIEFALQPSSGHVIFGGYLSNWSRARPWLFEPVPIFRCSGNLAQWHLRRECVAKLLR